MKSDLRVVWLAVFLIVFSSSGFASSFFQDSFESGALDKIGSTGFKWSKLNSTGVTNGAAHDGGYSLKFFYRAGQDWSEQHFSLGTAHKDLWYRFWLRVPTNFYHGPKNNKFLALWMDGYSSKGDGPTVVWESWGDSTGGSTLGVHWCEGAYTTCGNHIQQKPFISIGDRGKWMQIVVHVKAATKRTLPIGNSSYPYRTDSDGVIELWRRWDGDTSFVKLHAVTNANIAPPADGPYGWTQGYLMGWANSAYLSDTEFAMDEIEFSTTSLLDVNSPIDPVTPPVAPAAVQLKVE